MIYVTSKKRKPYLSLRLVFDYDVEITNPISIADYFNSYFVSIGEKLTSSITVASEKISKTVYPQNPAN